MLPPPLSLLCPNTYVLHRLSKEGSLAGVRGKFLAASRGVGGGGWGRK